MADMHHIISDAVSQDILEEEFRSLYDGGHPEESELQYKDFATWQNSPVQRRLIQQQEPYWLKEFAGPLPVLDNLADYPRPSLQSFEGDTITFKLEPHEAETIRNITAGSSATVFIVILTIYNVLLAKLSGQEDIIVGTAISGRENQDLHQVIGMFVNTLPLRNYPSGDLQFNDFLDHVKKQDFGSI